MLLLIIFVVVTAVCGLILRYGPWSWDSDLPGVILAVIAPLNFVVAFIKVGGPKDPVVAK